MYEIKRWGKKILDFCFAPFTFLAAKWYKFIISKGIFFFPVSRSIFMKVGVLPVIDHYYYPMINPKKYLTKSLRDDRYLPGIDLKDKSQLELLQQFNYNEELSAFPYTKLPGNDNKYYYNNGMFGPGDSEILYSLIRYFKPRRIIEVGSGHSTLMSLNGIAANKNEDLAYYCDLICIEPYEIPWLEKLEIKLERIIVEKLDPSYFQVLEENDILFIDSSHVIRPQGDVLFEYLQLLPVIKKGVIVHVHDIFTPKDYLDHWVLESHNMWNEQYLLEGFLSCNSSFEILCSLNYLFYHHREAILSKCPVLRENTKLEPRSFWLRKIC